MPNKLELLVKKLSPYHTFSSLTSSFLLLPKNSLLPLGDRGSFQQREEKNKKKKGDSTECHLPKDREKQVNCKIREGKRGI